MLGDGVLDTGEWMPGNVEPEHFPFEGQFVFGVPFLVGHLTANTSAIESSAPPPASPNRSNCPTASAFLVPSTDSMASPCTRNSPCADGSRSRKHLP